MRRFVRWKYLLDGCWMLNRLCIVNWDLFIIMDWRIVRPVLSFAKASSIVNLPYLQLNIIR